MSEYASSIYGSLSSAVYGKVPTDEAKETQLVGVRDEENGTNSLKLGNKDEDDCGDGKLSFLTMSYVVLLGDSTRGLMFPTLWPLVSSLGGTKTNQGVVVAAFSMGRVVVSPFYGWFSSHRGYRDILVFAHIIVAVAALWYTRVTHLYGLLGAQIALGLGCGTLGVTRSYVAESVPRAQRTIYLGRLTAMQYAGFTTTPFLGSVMYHLGVRLDQAGFGVDALAFPAALILVGALLACALLLSPSFIELSPERRSKLHAKHEREAAVARATAGITASVNLASRRDENFFAVVGLILNVITKGSIGCYETIGVIYAEQSFRMQGPTVGYVVAVCGFCGVCALLSFKPLSKFFDDVQLMIGGIFVMIVSCALLVNRVRPDNLSSQTQQIVWATAVFLMYAVGYPIGHTAVIGWFSKAMGKRPQGLLMGLFASAGSVARVAFPIFTGVIAQRFDTDTVFITLFFMLTTTVLLITCFNQAFRNAAN